MTNPQPGARAPIIDSQGRPTAPFLRFLQTLAASNSVPSTSDLSEVTAQLAALQAEIDALPESSAPTLRVLRPLILTQEGNEQVLRIVESPTAAGSGRSTPQRWVFA